MSVTPEGVNPPLSAKSDSPASLTEQMTGRFPSVGLHENTSLVPDLTNSSAGVNTDQTVPDAGIGRGHSVQPSDAGGNVFQDVTDGSPSVRPVSLWRGHPRGSGDIVSWPASVTPTTIVTANQPPLDERESQRPSLEGWKFSGPQGLDIDVKFATEEDVVDHRIPLGTFIGEMHFTPDYSGTLVFNNSHHILLAGLTEFQRFFQEIDSGKSEPTHLVGYTNRYVMAQVTRRLGFTITLDPDTIDPDDPADRLYCNYYIQGETKVARQRLTALLAKKDRKGRTFPELLHDLAALED